MACAGRLAWLLVVAAAAVVLMTAQPALAEIDEEDPERMELYIERKMRKNDLYGMSVAAVYSHQIHTYGSAHPHLKEHKDKPITPESVFPVGGISKLVTAILVMRQVEAGKVDLDAPVNQYISSSWRYISPASITVRQLLTHTAGLEPTYDFSYFEGSTWAAASTMHKQFKNGLSARFPPGDHFHYTHLGYDFLGMMLEDVTGEEFAAHADKVLFKPLGMTRTTFLQDEESERDMPTLHHTPTFPSRWTYNATYHVKPQRIPQHMASLGLRSTASDLAQLVRLMLHHGEWKGQRILSEDSVVEMERLQVDTCYDHDADHTGQHDGWGIGAWAYRRENSKQIMASFGYTPGTSAALIWRCDLHAGAVVLMNQGNMWTKALAIATRLSEIASDSQANLKLRAKDTKYFGNAVGLYRIATHTLDPKYWYLKYTYEIMIKQNRWEKLFFHFPGFSNGVFDMQPLGQRKFAIYDDGLNVATIDFNRDYTQFRFLSFECDEINWWISWRGIDTTVTYIGAVLFAIVALRTGCFASFILEPPWKKRKVD